MARSTQEIYETMDAATGAEPLLSGWYANMSKTAIWRLWLWVVAAAHNLFEVVFDTFKTDVDLLVQAAQVGNSLWYRTQILGFQYGDSLTVVNDKYVYSVDDDTKKIVTRCAIEEMSNATLRVKVAKGVTTLSALTTDETNALISYIKKVRFAGVRFQVFTNNGDQLKIYFSIYFDPIIPQATVQTNIENTIKNYVSNLPFNGELLVTKLIDELQKIEGVNDVVFTSGASRFSISDSYESFTRTVTAVGGYFSISTNSGETLTDTITYIAQ